MSTTLVDDYTVAVPFDGKLHDCVCGGARFRVSDHFGWTPDGMIHSDDDGRAESFCRHCERELVVAR